MNIQVVIATVGRPEMLCRTLEFLPRQTRRADGVVVVSVSPEDVAGADRSDCQPKILFSEKGLCKQRNTALQHVQDYADIVIFFDDDFIPADDYIECVERIFSENPEVVGVTGELLADGIHHGGFSVEQAQAILARRENPTGMTRPRYELYGCNMAVRMRDAKGMKFDENLPLYGWQEDVDFTNRLGRKGRQLSTDRVTGVHLGTRGGRTSGKRLGYSQIANILYLRRKGTMRAKLGYRLMFQNVCSNFKNSLRVDPFVDFRGRLHGNFLAFADYIRGRGHPLRVMDM